jgi:N-acetylmuramoyl-L-alanine amidase
MRLRQRTDLIVIHCAATKPGMDIGAAEIDRWHRERGFAAIGYHFVIRRNGALELGRDLMVTGAHVAGHNHRSVGICLVGGIDDHGRPDDNFTPAQWARLEDLVESLARRFPGARVIGHRNLDHGKACPSFDAIGWWARYTRNREHTA